MYALLISDLALQAGPNQSPEEQTVVIFVPILLNFVGLAFLVKILSQFAQL